MEASLSQTKQEEVVRQIDQSRSICLLVSWALDILSEEGTPPGQEERRMELMEGASHVLDHVASGLRSLREELDPTL